MRALPTTILASIVLAFAAPVAHAGDLSTTSWARQGIDAAVKHWHAWPSACPSIHVESAPRFADGRMAQATLAPTSPEDCRIQVSTEYLPMVMPYDREMACTLMVHEYGHLLGWGHKDRPQDGGIHPDDEVMESMLNVGTVPECKPKPKPKAHAKKAAKRKARR